MTCGSELARDCELTGNIDVECEGAIASKRVTYDFARLMDGATEVKCSEFGDEIIKQMG